MQCVQGLPFSLDAGDETILGGVKRAGLSMPDRPAKSVNAKLVSALLMRTGRDPTAYTLRRARRLWLLLSRVVGCSLPLSLSLSLSP